MEGKQERRGKDKRKEGRRRRSSEVGAKTELAMTLSVAKKANASAGDNGACSDGRNRKDKCGSGEGCRTRDRGSSKTESLCYGSGPG